MRILGNTVLDEAAIRGVVDRYLGKPVSTADLEEIRRQLTLLYVNRGYINSGVLIPGQNVVNGVVAFRVVEGRVSDIEVTGTDHFDPEYFRSRLARGTEPGPETSWVKLTWSDMTQHLSSHAVELCGEAAPLWRGAHDLPGGGKWQRQWLWSGAASIAGGTSEVQKNIVSERILGMPRG